MYFSKKLLTPLTIKPNPNVLQMETRHVECDIDMKKNRRSSNSFSIQSILILKRNNNNLQNPFEIWAKGKKLEIIL
jgi:hypothetical protein